MKLHLLKLVVFIAVITLGAPQKSSGLTQDDVLSLFDSCSQFKFIGNGIISKDKGGQFHITSIASIAYNLPANCLVARDSSGAAYNATNLEVNLSAGLSDAIAVQSQNPIEQIPPSLPTSDYSVFSYRSKNHMIPWLTYSMEMTSPQKLAAGDAVLSKDGKLQALITDQSSMKLKNSHGIWAAIPGDYIARWVEIIQKEGSFVVPPTSTEPPLFLKNPEELPLGYTLDLYAEGEGTDPAGISGQDKETESEITPTALDIAEKMKQGEILGIYLQRGLSLVQPNIRSLQELQTVIGKNPIIIYGNKNLDFELIEIEKNINEIDHALRSKNLWKATELVEQLRIISVILQGTNSGNWACKTLADVAQQDGPWKSQWKELNQKSLTIGQQVILLINALQVKVKGKSIDCVQND